MKYSFHHGNETLIVLISQKEIPFRRTESVLSIHDVDWNADLSPWKADAVFPGDSAFEGKADALIQELIRHPVIGNTQWKYRIIAGYSLAGLFSLYACTKTDLFDGCVSCSGSLWYPGFLQYLKEHSLNTSAVYLSLGEKEKYSRNPILSSVELCMGEAAQYLKKDHICRYEMNPGGHFTDPDGRMLKGIAWLIDHLPD